ncbi:MAG: hypothetical protein NZ583_05050 [Desulfobacterota bacterium]|nr:hypothetical protein [Thermodesulfobacteriota bacterium]MDW8002294.1 enolase C-terminal domain-like protein [Deltaproteobacteria bacterium]
MRIKAIETKRQKIPLKLTFKTASGASRAAESLIVRVILEDGHEGVGESPTSIVYKSESIERIEGFIKTVIPNLVGNEIEDYPVLIEELKKRKDKSIFALSGLEVALFRAYLALIGVSEFSYWGGKRRVLETDITIPNIEINLSKNWASFFAKKGFRSFKIKLKGDPTEDLRFLEGISKTLKRILKDKHSIRLDMNGSYSLKNFYSFSESLKKLEISIEFIEQPLPKEDYRGLKELIKRSDFEIILDESVLSVEDLDRIGLIGFKGGINIKIPKSGISESKKIYDLAKAQNLKLMIGCMMESIIGLKAGIFFAMGKGELDYIDLDAVHFLKWKKFPPLLSSSGPFYVYSGS